MNTLKTALGRLRSAISTTPRSAVNSSSTPTSSSVASPTPTANMSNRLVIFGGTGQQGGSVAKFVLADSELSKKYKVRAVCRDISKPAAQELVMSGAEVVKGDLDDVASLSAALKGVHTVFGMTKTVYDEKAKEREVRQGRALADAAVAAGAQFIIFSSAAHAEKISGGKYPVAAYDSKAEVEAYIRTLPIRSAFIAPATFMQNFAGMMAPRPSPDESGSYAIANIHTGTAKFPWLDVAGDTGKFVGAILADPAQYEGKVLNCGTDVLSLDEVTKLMSTTYGKQVTYSVMPEEKYRSYLPPAAQDAIVNMFYYIQDFGYYGAETEETVAWAAKQARGKPASLEAFLRANTIIKS